MQVNNVSASNYGVQKNNNNPSFGMAVRLDDSVLQGVCDFYQKRVDDAVELARETGKNARRAIKKAQRGALSDVKHVRKGTSKRFFSTNSVDTNIYAHVGMTRATRTKPSVPVLVGDLYHRGAGDGYEYAQVTVGNGQRLKPIVVEFGENETPKSVFKRFFGEIDNFTKRRAQALNNVENGGIQNNARQLEANIDNALIEADARVAKVRIGAATDSFYDLHK